MAELLVESLAKEYPTRGEPLRVLRDVTFRMRGGQSAAVLGPSGSGKSTLLHVLGTLERPTSGTVALDGEDPFQLDEPSLARFRNRRIGFVFQDHHLLPQISALDNVLIPALARGTPHAATVARARDLLDRVGLSARLDHRPAELSGGERQRVALARALLHQPSLILADEPTGNLDRINASQVADLLLQLLRDRGDSTILLVVTHSTELARRCGHQWELSDGQLAPP
jgi:lipoprotein-releasing system ATP-binding protein